MTKGKAQAQKPAGGPRPEGKTGAQRKADHPEADWADLSALQQQVGNRAVGRLLAQGSGRSGPAGAAVEGRERGAGAFAWTLLVRAVAAELQRHTIGEQVQREGEQAAEPQPADRGRVSIRDVQHTTYAVSGENLAEVAAQLDPVEWGRCTYRYRYKYRTTNEHATRVDITLELSIRLPRWQGRGWRNASEAARNEWQRMLGALRAHEEEHAQIARRWAPVFQERLLNQHQSMLQQIFDNTLAEVDAEQAEFDVRTQHGQTQGVTLDWISIQ